MTTSVPSGQSDSDDWFDLDKYREAAVVAFDYSKKKAEVAGEESRKLVGKKATEERQTEREQEARDSEQAARAYRY